MISPAKNKKSLLFLSFAALGIVYGDIGTSPLYAFNQIFFGHGSLARTPADVLGAISLVFWALTLLIAIKYIVLVLRADNEGQGGVFALYGLFEKIQFSKKWIYITLLIIAAGFLFGDGIITPVISVISSSEGLSNATSSLSPLVIPLTLVILTILFAIQKKGTAKVGTLFAPAIIIWFVSIAFLGIRAIWQQPSILLALNPYFGFVFLLSHPPLTILFTLGAVMLTLTGGEALYADLGHFGTLPIRISWFTIVYPAIVLNYFGQGAYLLGKGAIYSGNVFFSMIPRLWVYPMVAIATVATIIASQALISGAFSLASQAISLKLFPFFKVIHTETNQEGQIYVPFINWSLYIGCVLLTLIFRSSNNLGSAYGLAVSGVMLITSFSMIQIAKQYWKWNSLVIYGIFIPFICIDSLFFTANSLKFVQGGYIPLGIGLALFFIMTTWKWGKTQTESALRANPATTVAHLIRLKEESVGSIPKTAIILTPNAITSSNDQVPVLNHLLLERYGLLPSTIIFLTIKQLDIPYCNRERFEIYTMYQGEHGEITSVILHFGYRENPNARAALERMAHHKVLNISSHASDWYIHIIQVRTASEKITSLFGKIRYHVFRFLYKNTDSAETYFGLGNAKNISAEIFYVALR